MQWTNTGNAKYFFNKGWCFFLTIYYFWIFNLLNLIQLIQTNSDLIFLFVIVSLLPFFFAFCWLTLILIILKKKLNFSRPVFIGTLCSILLVFSFVCCLTQECLTCDWRWIQCWLRFNSYLRYIFWNGGKMEGGGTSPALSPLISPFPNRKIDNWWCKAYHQSSYHFSCAMLFFLLVSCL